MVKYASLLFLWVIVAFLTSCHRDFGNHYSNAHKERIKAIMDSAKDSGSVKSLLDTFIRQGDLYGQVLAHETLGKISVKIPLFRMRLQNIRKLWIWQRCWMILWR